MIEIHRKLRLDTIRVNTISDTNLPFIFDKTINQRLKRDNLENDACEKLWTVLIDSITMI